MVYFSFKEPFLLFAFWIGAVGLLLAALITMVVVYLRLRRLYRGRRERRFVLFWEPWLLQLIHDPSLNLPKLSVSDHIHLLKLWNHLHESLPSDAKLGLNRAAARLGCFAMAKKMLKGGGRAKQLLAILTLGKLGDHAAWHDLMAETVYVGGAASLNALRAMAQIDASRVFREMTPTILSRNDWPVGCLVAIFQESPSRFYAPLLQAAAEGPIQRQLKALRLVEGLRLSLPLPTLTHLLADSMPPEVIVAALRVTLYPQLLVVVRTHLTHSDWRVRVQAVKALGRIGRTSDVSLLSSLLDDPEWWVRYRTAQALADVPSFNIATLNHLFSMTNDRFAHDMLNQVMAERGVI